MSTVSDRTDARTFADALGAYLRQFAPLLTAMGGASAKVRIGQDAVPVTVPYAVGSPHVVFTEIDTPAERLLDRTQVTLVRSVWQLDVWSKDAAERSSVAKALRSALRSWRGLWGARADGSGGFEIRDVQIDLDRASSENPNDSSDDRDWRQMLQIACWHRTHEES